MNMLKRLVQLSFSAMLLVAAVTPISASEKMGMHILHPSEIIDAKEAVSTKNTRESWHYVTIPYTIADIDKHAEWQAFFDRAKENKIIPLVRLTTTFENQSWQKPSKKQIVDLITALNALDWPTDKKHIIVFNEVNHAKEWSGQINPTEYGQVLAFTADWAHSENSNFIVLPAAMDLAAPNGTQTMEAFTYWNQVILADSTILHKIDAWNSHSYPNPAFSAAPTKTGQNSLRGFELELAFVEEKTSKQLPVYITETGWETNNATRAWLSSYYEYALDHVWSHPQVVAVTPFILKGDPGPFSGFSFLKGDGSPTEQYLALRKALEQNTQISSVE